MNSVNDSSPDNGRFDLSRRLLPGGHIQEIEELTPTSRRMRLAGPKLAGLNWRPGDHIRVRIGSMLTLRTYSVWDFDSAQGWIDLVLFDHGTPDSIGLQWAENARTGQYVTFVRDPRAVRLTGDAPWHLFAGEESAAAGFGALLRAVPAHVPVFGVHQADTEADHIDLPRPLTRIARHGTPAASSRQLVDAVAALDLPDTPGAAYLAGEARTIQMIRTHLVNDRGWNRRAISTKPFWTPGKRGMD
ncbi:siderophore-interacting protein [Streptomyces griseoaurantiacus]|uniref:siderophore-interacting protein n=1 Tax=Streptomyces griseoaurantiacus TaxID=68213 RepID=UPI0037B11C06